jgi:hypothetical protein
MRAARTLFIKTLQPTRGLAQQEFQKSERTLLIPKDTFRRLGQELLRALTR